MASPCPIFRPTAEEWLLGPHHYVKSLLDVGTKTGILKIIPPAGWNPSIPGLKPFETRIQEPGVLIGRVRLSKGYSLSLKRYWLNNDILMPRLKSNCLDIRDSVLKGIDIGVEDLKIWRRWIDPYEKWMEGKINDRGLLERREKRERKSGGMKSGVKSGMKGGMKPKTGMHSEVKDLMSESKPAEKKIKIDTGSGESSDLSDLESVSSANTSESLDSISQHSRSSNSGSDESDPDSEESVSDTDSNPADKDSDTTSVTSRQSIRVSRKRKAQGLISVKKRQMKNCIDCNVVGEVLECKECGDFYCVPCCEFTLYCDWFLLFDSLYRCILSCGRWFGFKEIGEKRTLNEFQSIANDFKRKYLKKTKLKNTQQDLDAEFWRLTRDFGSEVQVEYGADLHYDLAVPPLSELSNLKVEHAINGDDKWNLKNLRKESLFSELPLIPGLTTSWFYAGMLFTAFCFHLEDNYTYSINYNHFGESKKWYAVSGDQAELFESTIREENADLFRLEEDLLADITLMLPIPLLIEKGINVVHAEQKAGEFIVSFPKAYHCGYNTGFNLAEAVNFGTSDWLKYGLASIELKSAKSQEGLICFDELVVGLIYCGPKVDECQEIRDVFEAVYAKEMKGMELLLNSVTELRTTLITHQNSSASATLTGPPPSPNKLCITCKSSLYLSHLYCHTHDKTYCLTHHTSCPCPKELHINVSSSAMVMLREKVGKACVGPDVWTDRVRRCVAGDVNVEVLEGLLAEAKAIGLASGAVGRIRANLNLVLDWCRKVDSYFFPGSLGRNEKMAFELYKCRPTVFESICGIDVKFVQSVQGDRLQVEIDAIKSKIIMDVDQVQVQVKSEWTRKEDVAMQGVPDWDSGRAWTKPSYPPAREPYIQAREPYISPNEPYIAPSQYHPQYKAARAQPSYIPAASPYQTQTHYIPASSPYPVTTYAPASSSYSHSYDGYMYQPAPPSYDSHGGYDYLPGFARPL